MKEDEKRENRKGISSMGMNQRHANETNGR
jgi:hypothetical protein